MHLSFTVILRQWGQYSRTYCGCAANSPLIKVCVCFACAPRTQNTHTLLLQLGVAAGDPPVRGYCPCCLSIQSLLCHNSLPVILQRDFIPGTIHDSKQSFRTDIHIGAKEPSTRVQNRWAK